MILTDFFYPNDFFRRKRGEIMLYLKLCLVARNQESTYMENRKADFFVLVMVFAKVLYQNDPLRSK